MTIISINIFLVSKWIGLFNKIISFLGDGHVFSLSLALSLPTYLRIASSCPTILRNQRSRRPFRTPTWISMPVGTDDLLWSMVMSRLYTIWWLQAVSCVFQPLKMKPCLLKQSVQMVLRAAQCPHLVSIYSPCTNQSTAKSRFIQGKVLFTAFS